MLKLNHVSEDKIQEMISDRFSSKNNISAILEQTGIKPNQDQPYLSIKKTRETNAYPEDKLGIIDN